ncbi:unnamed protein product [Gongylonema pulchrum]|uniref:Ion_trans domain-containing protein n=1 Tax=Gongylonema pulchrum TaxID=637853 RepID=A0A183EM63_9BILA|nr:unnamed protein product [Gongylonema pulchrum]
MVNYWIVYSVCASEELICCCLIPSESQRFFRMLWMLAILLRVLAYFFCIEFLEKRPELIVPQNSFRRLVDGIQMFSDGVSPYDGDMVHCQPVLLYLFGAFIGHPALLLAFFVALDVITSEILRNVAMHYMRENGSANDDVERVAELVAKW